MPSVILIREMLSYCVTIVVMQVVTSDGRNCFGNEIERPSDTINIHALSGQNEPGSPGCPGGPRCRGSQGSQAGQGGQGGLDGEGTQTNQILEHARPRKRCCPYDFDSKLCQVVNDRLLCGYNMNVGRPASNDRAYSLSGGCRMRGGRLECGYEHGPFTNARRPPGWDEVHPFESVSDNIIVGDKDSPVNNGQSSFEDLNPINPKNQPVVLNSDESGIETLKMSIPPNVMLKYSTKKYKSTTKCVEIHERVVCKKI